MCSIESKVNNLTTNIGEISKDFKEISDLPKDLKEEVMAIASGDLVKSCAELKGYFSYIEREYFPELEIKLVNKIDSSSNDVITTLTNDIDNDYNQLKKEISANYTNSNEKLDKILEILIKVGPNLEEYK